MAHFAFVDLLSIRSSLVLTQIAKYCCINKYIAPSGGSASEAYAHIKVYCSYAFYSLHKNSLLSYKDTTCTCPKSKPMC